MNILKSVTVWTVGRSLVYNWTTNRSQVHTYRNDRVTTSMAAGGSWSVRKLHESPDDGFALRHVYKLHVNVKATSGLSVLFVTYG